MEETADIFSSNPHFVGAPYSNESTSKAAAIDAAPHAKTQRERLKKMFSENITTGFTDQELAAITGWGSNVVNPRRWELSTAKGCVEIVAESGERRKTKAGKNAIVWKLVVNYCQICHKGLTIEQGTVCAHHCVDCGAGIPVAYNLRRDANGTCYCITCAKDRGFNQ